MRAGPALRFAFLAALAPLACNFAPGAVSGSDGPDPDDPAEPDSGTGVIGPDECAPGVSGCVCIADLGEGGCTHGNGGRFGDGACSPSFQCCDGAWRQGHGSCGACTCTDDSEGTIGCGTAAEVCFPEFDPAVSGIGPDLRADMTGKSWHAELPCPSFDTLRLLAIPHWGFDGAIHRGELVVGANVVTPVLDLFERMYMEQFPIERMERVDAYGGDDDASMAANNTSAFNCREVTGGGALSRHSFGVAIDINPVQNPYVNDATVLPAAGADYAARTPLRPGMIVRPDAVTRTLVDIGWEWGGDWDDPIDYQHVSTGG